MQRQFKILTVIGARPQFIKAAAFSYGIKGDKKFNEIIIHTGQHYDSKMSKIFFDELKLPMPNYILQAGGLGHGAMTGRLIEEIERICLEESPDIVLVYGDTNSTLAGAIAAAKLNVPLAHVEAGLRSFNMSMPEEVNRILTDRVSSLLFCPSDVAKKNLDREGFRNYDCEIVVAGDVMYDMVKVTQSHLSIDPSENPFILATIHRAENTDNHIRIRNIIEALNKIADQIPIKLPIHPRTKKMIDKSDIFLSSKVELIDPVGYFEMISLLSNCSLVITDSGGVQKEAYFMKKNCLVIREETEWTELIESNNNRLVGWQSGEIIAAYKDRQLLSTDFSQNFYGNGASVGVIKEAIYTYLESRKQSNVI